MVRWDQKAVNQTENSEMKPISLFFGRFNILISSEQDCASLRSDTHSSKITVKSHIYVKSAFIRTLLSLRAFGSGGMYSPVKVLLHGNNRTQVVMDREQGVPPLGIGAAEETDRSLIGIAY